MGANIKGFLRLVEDFVNMIGTQMSGFQDIYEVTENLGEPRFSGWMICPSFKEKILTLDAVKPEPECAFYQFDRQSSHSAAICKMLNFEIEADLTQIYESGRFCQIYYKCTEQRRLHSVNLRT